MRLIDHPSASGAWNMAVDQALLQSANATGQATLRIYRWQPATLSLGYFQKAADRNTHPASMNCALVRRASGGGAIMHDQEWTYSLCLPSDHAWAQRNVQLYRLMHRLLVESLAELGVVAGTFEPGQDQAGEPGAFLCFQRRSEGDLVMQGVKIGGSAQRRLDRSLIQHGSLLLQRSEFAPELPGILDLVAGISRETLEEDLLKSWLRHVARQLGSPLEPGELSDEEAALARSIEAERFLHPDWTLKR